MRVRTYVRITRRQPSGCALGLLTLAGLLVFAGIGDASPVAGFAIMALAALGILAYLLLPVYLHRNHAKLTPGCRLCAAKAQKLRAAEQRGRALAAQLAEYARLDAKSRRP